MNIVPQPANVACKKQRHVINLLKIWSTRQASGVVKLWGTYWAMRILSGGASLADLSAPWPSLERFSTNKDLLGFSASICSASFAPSYRNRKSIEQRITSPTQELQGLYYSSCSSCSSYSSCSSCSSCSSYSSYRPLDRLVLQPWLWLQVIAKQYYSKIFLWTPTDPQIVNTLIRLLAVALI